MSRRAWLHARASGPPFNPLSVGACALWYDLRVCTQGAGIVTALPDQSGNARNATIPGGSEPGYSASGLGGLPTANFPDTDTKRIQTPTLGITTGPVTLVLVATASSAFGGPYACATSDASVEISAPADKWTLYTNDGAQSLSDASSDTTVPSVVVGVFNGASSRLYASKKTAVTGTLGSYDITAATMRLGTYGAALNGVFSQVGSTAQHLVYNGALSDADVRYLLDGFGALAGISIGA